MKALQYLEPPLYYQLLRELRIRRSIVPVDQNLTFSFIPSPNFNNIPNDTHHAISRLFTAFENGPDYRKNFMVDKLND